MWPMMMEVLSRMLFMVLSVVGGNSFPKPLSAKEEREALDVLSVLWERGRLEPARIKIHRN